MVGNVRPKANDRFSKKVADKRYYCNSSKVYGTVVTICLSAMENNGGGVDRSLGAISACTNKLKINESSGGKNRLSHFGTQYSS